MSLISADTYFKALQAELGNKVIPITRGGINWYNRSRPQSLGSSDFHGIVNHHTGSGASLTGQLAYIWDGGNLNIPGPYAHAINDPSGWIYLVGWMRVNSAGIGDHNVLNAVIRNFDLPKPTINDTDGNRYFYSLENMNPGTSDNYPDAQLSSLVKYNVAIIRAHKWNEKSSIHHREWTNRKIDMSWYGDMRGLIKECLAAAPGKWTFPAKGIIRPTTPPIIIPPKPEGFLMALTDAQQEEVRKNSYLAAVRTNYLANVWARQMRELIVAGAANDATRVNTLSEQIDKDLADLNAKLDAEHPTV